MFSLTDAVLCGDLLFIICLYVISFRLTLLLIFLLPFATLFLFFPDPPATVMSSASVW